MQMYKLSFFTGPTLVHEIAKKMREAGIRVTCEGTETVWVEAEGHDSLYARLGVASDLRRKHGTDFGLMRTRFR